MRVLVAGATGTVGRAVCQRLVGHEVQALSRRQTSMDGASVLVANAMTDDLTDAMTGIDIVVSALGAPISASLSASASFDDIDVVANTRLLEAAQRAGVERFVYVGSLSGGPWASTRYARAHDIVAERLAASPLSTTTLRPVGMFNAYLPFLDMARAGLATLVGDGTARTNPIHPECVAESAVGHVETGPEDVPLGGPEVLTRRRTVELAFEALGKRPRITTVPTWLPRSMAPWIRSFHPRMGDMVAFVTEVTTHDAVAPSVGTRTLGDYFRSLTT